MAHAAAAGAGLDEIRSCTISVTYSAEKLSFEPVPVLITALGSEVTGGSGGALGSCCTLWPWLLLCRLVDDKYNIFCRMRLKILSQQIHFIIEHDSGTNQTQATLVAQGTVALDGQQVLQAGPSLPPQEPNGH